MSADKEMRLLRIISLLMKQTRDGTLEWQEKFGNTYQATLGGQTLVLERDDRYTYPEKLAVLSAEISRPKRTATLEIRDKKGEVVERIEAPNRSHQGALMEDVLDLARATGSITDSRPYRYSKDVIGGVDTLYDLVISRKEILSDAALENLLDALEGRERAK